LDCSGHTQLVQPFLDGELEPKTADELRAHGRRCYLCHEQLVETRNLFDLLNRLPRERAPAGFASGVLCALPDRVGARSFPRRIRSLSIRAASLGLAAGLVLLPRLVAHDDGAAGLLDALGRMATWWYSWTQDLAATLAWIRSTDPIETWTVLRSIAPAAGLILEASASGLILGWLVATVTGLWLGAQVGGRPPLSRT
jgi:hypothetical protein